MSYNANDNIILVAPRPVRIASNTPYSQFHSSPIAQRPHTRAAVRYVSAPADAFDKLKLAEDNADDDRRSDSTWSSERDAPSPRSSPRSNLPSEALEEFLSILRPSTIIFPPTSPVLRTSNGNTAYYPYRRSTSCSMSPSISPEGLGLSIVDRNDDVERDNENIPYPFKLIGSGHLASPVARNLARNPFQRHPSYDNAVNVYLRPGSASPSAVAVNLSPAAVPLPLPTPDEMDPDRIS